MLFFLLKYVSIFTAFSINTLENIAGAHFPTTVEANHNPAHIKEDLINIIKSLNQLDENFKSNNVEYNKIIEPENIELNDQIKEKKLQEILWLLKKNYNARTQLELIQNPLTAGARLYFIRNPDAIEEYKNYLKQRSQKPQTDKNIHRKRNVKEKLEELRRNVMFKAAEDTNEASQSDNNFDKKETIAEDKSTINEDNKPLNNNHKTNGKVDGKTFEEKKIPVDSLELHNSNVHKSKNPNNGFREKNKWNDENHDTDENKKWNKKFDNNKYESNLDSYKYKNNDEKYENNWETTKKTKKAYDWDKLTTEYTTKEYKRKKLNYDEPKYKPKLSYKYPKKEKKRERDDFSLYGRTSIPYVGKKGIFEDE